MVDIARFPVVPEEPPNDGDLLVELLVFYAAPSKNHWAYWVPSRHNNQIGVKVHAIGDPLNGYSFQATRSHCLDLSGNEPSQCIPLQWVSPRYFDEEAMLNYGEPKEDDHPIGPFEITARLAEPPGKALRSVSNVETNARGAPNRAMPQDNCQTWICESAGELVKAGIFKQEVVAFLRSIVQ